MRPEPNPLVNFGSGSQSYCFKAFEECKKYSVPISNFLLSNRSPSCPKLNTWSTCVAAHVPLHFMSVYVNFAEFSVLWCTLPLSEVEKVGPGDGLFDHEVGAVLRIRIKMIRIQDRKKIVTDPEPDRTLIRIRIQAKNDSVPGKI